MAILATMHGKEAAVAPAFAELLDLEVTVPERIDTDALGTFSGEVERPGDMLETARIKAEVGIELTGHRLAIANEGAYGPHPFLPHVASGTELMLWLDAESGIEIHEATVVMHNNYMTQSVRPGEPLDTLLEQIGFPGHALVVMPNRADASRERLAPTKGIRDPAELKGAIDTAAAASADGAAMIQSDMRAHMNPTRMRAIANVARSLATRLRSRCKACDAPGFGIVRRETGLPCRFCSTPTQLPHRDTHGCPRCAYEVTLPVGNDRQLADPRHCGICNP